MPVTYVIRFKTVAGQTEKFLQLLNGVLNAMRDEENFHQAVLHADPEDDTRFMLYETWENHEDVVNVQVNRPYRRAFHDALPTVLSEPRDIQVWTPMRSDRNPRRTLTGEA